MTGAQLRRIRKRLGLTQVGFAEELGLHPNTVARKERGEEPTGGTVEKLARLLDKIEREGGQKARPRRIRR